jgi:hypothetical protein
MAREPFRGFQIAIKPQLLLEAGLIWPIPCGIGAHHGGFWESEANNLNGWMDGGMAGSA